MTQKGKKILATAPNWLSVTVCIIACIVVAFMMYFEIDARYPPMTNHSRFQLMLFLLILSSARYVLFQNDIVLYVLCFPVRRIQWKKITGALFVPEFTDAHGGIHHASVLLFTTTCQYSEFSCDDAVYFRKNNKWKVLKVLVPEKKQRSYFDAIEKCLGFSIDLHLLDPKEQL